MATMGQMCGFMTFQAPTGSIGDDAINANQPLSVSKVHFNHIRGTNFGLEVSATPTSKAFIVHHAASAGTIRFFRALLEDTGTSTNIDFDLKIYNDANPTGASVLSAAVNITHSIDDRDAQLGTISSATYVAGDIFVIQMTVSSSTGATGAWAEAEFDEIAA